MAQYYFDSSALVKRYVAETGTGWVTMQCLPEAEHAINLVRITGAEIIAAFFRRVQTGSLTPADAQTAAAQFRREFRSRYEVIEVTEAVVDTAMRLAETHVLRGYDAVQLAAALELQSVRASLGLSTLIFVSADNRLNTVASLEGLPVENPNDHP
jgi:uncharacterized protein